MKLSLEVLIRDIGELGAYNEGVKEEELYEELKKKYEKVNEVRSRGRPRKMKIEREVGVLDKISKLLCECQKEEEESIKVKREVINDEVYLVSECGDVYDVISQDHIGSYKNGKYVLKKMKNEK